MLGAVQRALAAWSGCAVPAEVFGEGAGQIIPGQVLRVQWVQWDDAGSRGNFGLANLALRILSSRVQPLSVCRADPAIKGLEPDNPLK